MATRIRPSKPMVFMNMAIALSQLSTCARREVGCILLDANWKIIGSGYNGVGAGLPHCIDNQCKGSMHVSGQGLGECEAVHAEQNALMQCTDVQKIKYVITTASPCVHCMKMLLNTSAEVIYYYQEYDIEAIKLWNKQVSKFSSQIDI